MITEHDAVRGLVDSVPGNSYDDIASLATILHDHIRFEERELFPYIEKKLTEKELDEMRGNLEHEISCSSEWHNEFWK